MKLNQFFLETKDPVVFLVGNKNDLHESQDSLDEACKEGIKFAEANKIEFVSTSAYTGDNIEALFDRIGSLPL